MESTLKIFKPLQFDNSIVKQETHVYLPTTQNFNNNDEIRISIQHQDILTLPSKSFLRIEYTVEFSASATAQIANNAPAFLFDEIRYELNGVEIDRAKDVGMLSLIKGLLTYSPTKINTLMPAGWLLDAQPIAFPTATKRSEYAQIPLKLFLGFAEDYDKTIVNVKQELILIRSRNDKDFAKSDMEFKIEINKIEWHVDHIEVNDEVKLNLYNEIKKDTPILIPFRRFELHTLPSLRATDRDVWNVKTSTALERPRYVILAFQTKRRDATTAHADFLDHCNMRNLRVYLNSNVFPYNNLNLNIDSNNYGMLYHMYSEFQTSYGGHNQSDPCLTFKQFKERMLFVFDVSKQDESLKSSTIDLKIEMEGNEVFKEGTRAYCLIICDSVVEYTPLTGIVHKIVQYQSVSLSIHH